MSSSFSPPPSQRLSSGVTARLESSAVARHYQSTPHFNHRTYRRSTCRHLALACAFSRTPELHTAMPLLPSADRASRAVGSRAQRLGPRRSNNSSSSRALSSVYGTALLVSRRCISGESFAHSTDYPFWRTLANGWIRDVQGSRDEGTYH